MTARLRKRKEYQCSIHLRQQTSTSRKLTPENTRGEGKERRDGGE